MDQKMMKPKHQHTVKTRKIEINIMFIAVLSKIDIARYVNDDRTKYLIRECELEVKRWP